ncbi:MAG: MOSC domain-containing protein [Sphingopyxis sp.]
MPRIIATSARRGHHFSKTPQAAIRLIAGLGVEGDGHAGATVQHRSRARFNPALPNLRQVHLIDTGYIAAMADAGFVIEPGDIGENLLVDGVDLITLPRGTMLAMGDGAVVELTGLRNPCVQMDRFRPGLMAASLRRDDDGGLIRLTGVMAIVQSGGHVRAGDGVTITLPPPPHAVLEPV